MHRFLAVKLFRIYVARWKFKFKVNLKLSYHVSTYNILLTFFNIFSHKAKSIQVYEKYIVQRQIKNSINCN